MRGRPRVRLRRAPLDAPAAARAVIEVDDAPGWAAISPRGTRCFVANTRADTLSVISLKRRKEIRRIKVGDGPKQIEAARLPRRVICRLPRILGCTSAAN